HRRLKPAELLGLSGQMTFREVRRLQAETDMPIGPGAGIEHPRRRIRKNISEIAFGEITPDNGEILDRAVRHHLSEKTVLVRESFGWRLPPKKVRGYFLQVSHDVSPPGVPESLGYDPSRPSY